MNSIQVSAPQLYRTELRDILAKHPELQAAEEPGMVCTFTITGPADAMQAVRPELDAWQHEVFSREAW